MSHWFKFYGQDYLTDPKMISLSLAEKVYWLTILCLASNSDDGVIDHLTEDNLKMIAGVKPNDPEWSSHKSIFDTFVGLNLIRLNGSSIEVVNFKKRQESNLTGAERTANYRERLKKRHTSDIDCDEERHKSDARVEENRVEKILKKDMLTLFAEFWSAYPRKESKKKAELSFLKISPSPDLFAKIMAGLDRAKKSQQWTKDGGAFIPHPTTWLNQERWNDELESAKVLETGGDSSKYDGISKKVN